MTSQEIQQALEQQTKVIKVKQKSVKGDLAQVEPAVQDAQQGLYSLSSFIYPNHSSNLASASGNHFLLFFTLFAFQIHF